MSSRWTAFFVWAFVAGAAMFWALRLGATPLAMPPATVAMGGNGVTDGDLGRLLGAAATAGEAVPVDPGLSARLQLAGVMAPRVMPGESASTAKSGIALLVVDGKPARPFRTGARIDGDLYLLSVGLRSASIGLAGGPPAVVLELPLLPAAATGSLPAIPTGADVVVPESTLQPALGDEPPPVVVPE